MSIYAWRRTFLKYGVVGLMAKRKSIPREPLLPDAPRPQSEKMQALQEQVQHLQFEVDVLKETYEKKTQASIWQHSKTVRRQWSSVSWGRNMHCRCFWSAFIWPKAATTTRKLLYINRINSFPFVGRSHRFPTKTEEYMAIVEYIWRWSEKR